MRKTVFVLGAGASVEAGGPVMSNFMALAEDIYRNNRGGAMQESFNLVFKARAKLQRAFAKSKLDLDNIEELFAAFEMAGILGRLADLPENEVSQLALAMRRVITTTLDQNIEYLFSSETNRIEPAPVYAAFVRFVTYLNDEMSWPVSIITFNYDLALDYAFACNSRRISYGLHGPVDADAIDVLKLHGSLNWFRSQDEVVVSELIPVSPVAPDRVPTRVRKSSKEFFARAQTLPLTDDPVIVPPTWNKGQYHRDFQDLWQRAGHRLSEAENIIVIGYSAPPTDQFYRQLYALSTISDTVLSHYVCVGPQVGQHHQGLMGGASQARNIFQSLPSKFSECYSHLLRILDVESSPRPGLFSSGPIAAELQKLSRWPS